MAVQIILSIRYMQICYQPGRQDGAVILPARQHMNYHLASGISYQLPDLYQLAALKSTTTFFSIWTKWWKYCGDIKSFILSQSNIFLTVRKKNCKPLSTSSDD